MALQRVTRAELRVGSLDDCLEFHQAVLGLTLIDRQAGRAWLGAGTDATIDLVLIEQPGRTGTTGFSIAVDSREDLQALERHWRSLGIAGRSASAPEPGIVHQLSTDLPSGQVLSLVCLAPAGLPYLHPARGPHPRTSGIAPLDLDHITLRVRGHVRETIAFLRDAVGLKVSDIV